MTERERGNRRERDSNPRYGFPYSGFQDHRHRPLGHPSASTSGQNPRDFLKIAWIQVPCVTPSVTLGTTRDSIRASAWLFCLCKLYCRCRSVARFQPRLDPPDTSITLRGCNKTPFGNVAWLSSGGLVSTARRMIT